MATVLGKRARATEPSASSYTPRKRRARLNDENIDPSLVQSIYEDSKCASTLSLDEVHSSAFSSNKSAKNASVSAKSVTRHGKLALSPTKINRDSKSIDLSSSTEIPYGTRFCLLTDSEQTEENSHLVTPKTPRHRDALSKKIPVTPRHKVITAGTFLTPRTPRTPHTPTNAPTIYNLARQLFVRSANPGRLVGRDEERSKLTAFIQEGLKSKSGCSLYVSGPPGTGKSALVTEICNELQTTGDAQFAYINCMSVKSSKGLYCKLVEDLSDKETSEGNQLAVLKSIFFPKKGASSPVYVVTLDEIDHLLTLDLEILYTLFEWSLNRSSRLVLIGIANALDLTDRFLPRLKARNLKPQLLPFLPYTGSQIASVITTKLKSLMPCGTTSTNHVPFVHPVAIQFCSKKVASQTGDLRKAFDIIRRTIDVVENETKSKHLDDLNQQLQESPSRTPLVEKMNLSSTKPSPCSPKASRPTVPESLAQLTLETAPRATISHVARVTASAFNNGTAQRLETLNLQQKAALCALVALEKKTIQAIRDVLATPSKSASAVPTIRKVYDMYCGLCRRENALHPLTATEFADVVGSLETLSLIQPGEGRGSIGLGRSTPSKKAARIEERKIRSCVSEKELGACLDGPGGGILKGLLKGEE